MTDADLDPVQLLADNIRLRCERDAANRDYATMLVTLTDCQRRCTAYETEHRAAHDALDEVTSAPRTLPLDERVRVALVDVLAAAAVDTPVADTSRGAWTVCGEPELVQAADDATEAGR